MNYENKNPRIATAFLLPTPALCLWGALSIIYEFYSTCLRLSVQLSSLLEQAFPAVASSRPLCHCVLESYQASQTL